MTFSMRFQLRLPSNTRSTFHILTSSWKRQSISQRVSATRTKVRLSIQLATFSDQNIARIVTVQALNRQISTQAKNAATSEGPSHSKEDQSKNEMKKVTPARRTYCPYYGCKRTFERNALLYRHIRREHYRELRELQNGRAQLTFRNLAGDILDINSENCRDKLKNGEALLAEYKNNGDEPYYCPYKGCTLRCTARTNLYLHIRTCHDPELPKINTQRTMIYTSPDGKALRFDEGCRDLLEPNEKLGVVELLRNTGKAYCPYKGCSLAHSRQFTLYKHIRQCHDPSFPLLTRGTRHIFMGQDGSRVLFDENSRNMFAENQKIVVTDVFGDAV
ncbi:hypothetical protein BJV82DRAFT_615651 [Fennellomyces sp. T-0311]|nr:hypothetical protein BJV82DRAFT_615651 [Fennellomyces sp. T-0311]